MIKFLKWGSNHSWGGRLLDCVRVEVALDMSQIIKKSHQPPPRGKISSLRPYIDFLSRNPVQEILLCTTHHVAVTGPAALLLLLPKVAHDVVQVLAHQVASSKFPDQLLHVRQTTQSSVRALVECEILFLWTQDGPGKDCHY